MARVKRPDRTPKEERQLLLARWIVGLLCGFLLVVVAADLRDGVVHWGTNPGTRNPSPSQRGHHSSSSPEGIVFFILAFGLPSAVGVGFALFPRVFGRPVIWGPALALALVGFAGLATTNITATQ